VLLCASRGKRSKAIAWKLGITERTVKAHLQNIYQKIWRGFPRGGGGCSGRQGLA
jgi:FixJ family two-component response regulator